MSPAKKVCGRSGSRKYKGAVLIISMIFLLIFSALAVSMASMSAANVQVAQNLRKMNHARASAESGLDILRFWLNRVSILGTTLPEDRFTRLANYLQTDLTANSITNIPLATDVNVLSFGSDANPVTLQSSTGRHFTAQIQPTANPDILRIQVTGSAGDIDRGILVNYGFGTRAHTVFDFGVATKGPLSLAGNIELSGINVEVDSSVYIESENNDDALSIIGNSQIAGDVSIVNPDAEVTLQGGQAGIGGETGQDAIDNHVEVGVPPTEFPTPMPDYFEHYVTNTIDANTDTSSDATFENIRIPANTNPTFSGSVALKGIVFIETPNIITFTGNTSITGIIVGDGDLTDDSGTNQINFLGTVDSHPVTDLPDEPQFDGIHDETGTFLMAPGFSASFGGDFETLNGAIAANGIEFFGNAGGTIEGSILNYSQNEMTLTGNSDLFFNRSGTDQMPAGFGPEIILYYDSDSYCELVP